MASVRRPQGSFDVLAVPKEQRLQQHCQQVADRLFKAHYMKDVYLVCSDNVSVPVHKFILGAQSQCEPMQHICSSWSSPDLQHALNY
jgi:hypothetical protein